MELNVDVDDLPRRLPEVVRWLRDGDWVRVDNLSWRVEGDDAVILYVWTQWRFDGELTELHRRESIQGRDRFLALIQEWPQLEAVLGDRLVRVTLCSDYGNGAIRLADLDKP